MLGAGVAWVTQLMAQLAAVHGVADVDPNDIMPDFTHVVLEWPGQHDRVAAMQAAAEGLAAMAMAITTLPNAHAMAPVAMEWCGDLTWYMVWFGRMEVKPQLSAADWHEVMEAGKPAAMSSLRAAAAVVDSQGPSEELYAAVFETMPWAGAAWNAWCLELLSMLHPVLLPAWMHGKPRAEIQSFDCQCDADWALKSALGNVELTSLWRAKSGELRAVLLRYVLDNPWAPGIAVRVLQAVVQHWPGCLDQPAGV